MLLRAHLATALLMTVSLVSQTLACGPLPRGDNVAKRADSGEVEYPWSEPADDSASDPATTGYAINHVGINVRNLTESVDWYKRAFGLRLMFTIHVSAHFSITYMGHAQGGRNGTGYQTSAEMNRDKNNMNGLLEILNLDYPSWNLPAGIQSPNTFSHIGMIVPNITATQARLEAMGANIIKAAGAPFTIDGPFGDATGFTQAGDEISADEIDTIMQTLVPINTPLMFVADPDGNVIEVHN